MIVYDDTEDIRVESSILDTSQADIYILYIFIYIDVQIYSKISVLTNYLPKKLGTANDITANNRHKGHFQAI